MCPCCCKARTIGLVILRGSSRRPRSIKRRPTSGKKSMMATKWSGLSHNLPWPSQMVTSMRCALWEVILWGQPMPVPIQMEATVAESSTQATSPRSPRSMQSGLAKLNTMIGLRLWASLRVSMTQPTGAPIPQATR